MNWILAPSELCVKAELNVKVFPVASPDFVYPANTLALIVAVSEIAKLLFSTFP